MSQKFHIGKGNNHAIVRSVLKQRSWWTQSAEGEEGFGGSDVCLLWTQWKKQRHLDFLAGNAGGVKIYNKMEQNKQLSNKKGIFVNMRDYYRQRNQDPFEVLPLTFLVKHGLSDPEFKRFTAYYEDLSKRIQVLEREKQALLRARRAQINGERGSEWEEEEDCGEDDGDIGIREIEEKYRVPKNIWIIKPGENTNRGNGINVSASLSEIRSLVQRAHSSEQKEKTYII